MMLTNIKGLLISKKIYKLFQTDNCIIILGIISILPFLLISYFNNPNSDDFCYNIMSRNLGFLQSQLYWYEGWSGRYSSTAILSIEALVSNSFFLYKIFPIVLLVSLFGSIYLLISILFINLKKKDIFVFSFTILTLYLLQMPTIAEGFYWLAGSVTYQLSNVLALVFFSFLVKLIESNKLKYLLFTIIISFFLIGSNEITMLLINFIVSCILLIKLIEQKKINYSILILLIFVLFFSSIVFLSPGNALRSSASGHPHRYEFIYSITKTILALKTYFVIWLPLMVVFYFIFFDKIKTIQYSKIFKTNPIIVFLIVFCIPFISFFAGYWSIGRIPLRAINIAYFYFLIGSLYLFMVIHLKLKQSHNDFITYSKWVKYLLFVLIFLKLGQENNVRIAYSDLISGKANRYNLELKQRTILIQENKRNILEVPILINKPKTLFNIDITNDSEDWNNQCCGQYYNNIKIRTK